MNARSFVAALASVAAAISGLSCENERSVEPVGGVGGVQVDDVDGALLATLESAPACAESDISWGDVEGACAGPWRYEDHGGPCDVPSADPRCQGKGLFCPPGVDCVWGFGHQMTTQSFSKTATRQGTKTCESICCEWDPEGPSCPQPPCQDKCHTEYEEPIKTCTRERDKKILLLKAGLPDNKKSLVVPVGGVSAQEVSSSQAACGYKIAVPVPITGGYMCRVDACYAPVLAWSALGQSKAGLHPADHIVAGSPKCMTCEDLGTGDANKVNQKFNCLKQSRVELEALSPPPPAFDRAEALALLTRKQQLLYELHGKHLKPEQRAEARALYSAAGAPPCGTAPVDPAPPVGCQLPLLDEKRGDFVSCQRLKGAHVLPELRSYETFACAELLETYARVPADEGAEVDAACEVQGLRDEARATLEKLYDEQLSLVSSDPTSLGAPVRQLRVLDTWYAADRAALAITHPDELEPQELTNDLSWALGRLWSEFEKRDAITGPALAALGAHDQAGLEAAAAEAMRRGDGLARELIGAAFTPVGKLEPDQIDFNDTPLGGAPLLALLGDALGPLDARLRDLSIFHDFACLFRECRPPASLPPLAQAHRLVALAERKTELAGALLTTSDLAGWKAVFANLNAADRRTRFDAALAQAAGPGGLADADSQALPVSALPLARVVRESRGRFDRFAASGQFEPKAKKLDLGQDEDVRTEVHNVLSAKVAQLGAKADEYHHGLVAFTDALLVGIDNAAEKARLENLREQKAIAYDALERDLGGLAASADFEDQNFGNTAEALRAIEGGLPQNEYLQALSGAPFFPSGGGARYEGGDVDLGVLSVGGAPLPVATGQMLVVEATGQWSPTCALRAVEVYDPVGSPPSELRARAIKVDDPQAGPALTGPEGYTLQWSSVHHEAKSVSSTRSQSAEFGIRVEACVGLPDIVRKVGIDLKTCAYAQRSRSKTDSTTASSGAERSQSAAFSSGLRLSSVPFPNMPVGALLAVVEHPTSGSILDVQVVRSPSTAIVPDQNAKVTFVLNDRACESPASPASADRLTVRTHTMTSVGALAPKVLEAMSEVIDFVRGFEPVYRAQGRLLPAQASLLRSGAVQKLDAKLAPLGQSTDSLAAAAPALLNLFNALLDREAVRLERALEMQSLERQRALLRLEVDAIEGDLAANDDSSKLREMSQSLALRNVDGALLRADAGDLLAKTRDYLYPVLELWYPKHLAAKSQDQAFQANLRALSTEAPIDAALVPLVDRASLVVTQLLDAFPNAAFGNKPPGAELPLVMVSFPKPGVSGGGPFGGTFQSFWRKADPVRSQALWGAIDARQIAPVTVTADDLYTSGSGQGTLPCTEAVPVVKAMKFFFSSTKSTAYPNAPTLNGLSRWLEGEAPSTQSFLTEGGEKRYELAEGSVYKGVTGRVMYGKSHEAAQWFDDTSTFTRTIGLSPFGTFLVDFRGIDANWPGSGTTGPALTEAEELVVVMQIDSKAIAPGVALPGVRVCE